MEPEFINLFQFQHIPVIQPIWPVQWRSHPPCCSQCLEWPTWPLQSPCTAQTSSTADWHRNNALAACTHLGQVYSKINTTSQKYIC